jgi:DNA invertase Pin-like site-specific DNA recombinase
VALVFIGAVADFTEPVEVSLVAQTGLQFDLRSAQGKLIASLMAALAEFERDLLRERVRSGIAAARERGVVFGRRPGQRIKADRFAPKVLKLVGEGQSYREISHRLGLSKNTVLDIVKRDRLKMPTLSPIVGHEILPICESAPKGQPRRSLHPASSRGRS